MENGECINQMVERVEKVHLPIGQPSSHQERVERVVCLKASGKTGSQFMSECFDDCKRYNMVEMVVGRYDKESKSLMVECHDYRTKELCCRLSISKHDVKESVFTKMYEHLSTFYGSLLNEIYLHDTNKKLKPEDTFDMKYIKRHQDQFDDEIYRFDIDYTKVSESPNVC